MFQVALAVLKLIQHDLLRLDFGDINEYFNTFKEEEDAGGQYKLLPDFEKIITEAYKIKLTDDKIEATIRGLPQGPEVSFNASPPPVPVPVQRWAEVGGTDSVVDAEENKLIVEHITPHRATHGSRQRAKPPTSEIKEHNSSGLIQQKAKPSSPGVSTPRDDGGQDDPKHLGRASPQPSKGSKRVKKPVGKKKRPAVDVAH